MENKVAKTMWDLLEAYQEAHGGESEGLDALFEVIDTQLSSMPRTQLYQLLQKKLDEIQAEEESEESDQELELDHACDVPAISAYTVEEILRANGINPDSTDSGGGGEEGALDGKS
jgi:hypothetical protein